MTSLVIKINGENLEFFDNVTLSTSIDAISSSFSFSSFLNLESYEFSEIEVLRNDVIIFTGFVFSKAAPENQSPEPFNYKCYSRTGILEDCSLPLSSYPVQTVNKTLKEIVESICSNFDITVKFDPSADSEINKNYSLQSQSPVTKAAEIINKLCSQRDLILTHNSKGELIITKSLIGEDASPPIKIKSNRAYNYRKFFNKYLIVGQKGLRGGSARQAEAVLSEISEKRNITKTLTDGNSESAQTQAEAMKNDSYKSNSYNIDFHDYFENIGAKYKYNGVDMVVNSMNWNFRSGSETCSISLLNAKVYKR